MLSSSWWASYVQDKSCLSRAACDAAEMSGRQDQFFFFSDSGFLQFHLLTFWPASDAIRLSTSFPCLNLELRTQNSEPSWVTRKCNTPYWLAQRSLARMSLACMRLLYSEYAPHPQLYPPLTWAHWVVGGGGGGSALHRQCTAESATLASTVHSWNCDSCIDRAQLKLWLLYWQCTAETVTLASTLHSWNCDPCINSAQLQLWLLHWQCTADTVTLALTVHSWNLKLWLLHWQCTAQTWNCDTCIDSAQLRLCRLQVKTDEHTMQNFYINKYCHSCRPRQMSAPCTTSTLTLHSWKCVSYRSREMSIPCRTSTSSSTVTWITLGARWG